MSIISLVSPRLFVSPSVQPSVIWPLVYTLCSLTWESSSALSLYHTTSFRCIPASFILCSTCFFLSPSFWNFPLSHLFSLSLTLALFVSVFWECELLDKHGCVVLWLADPLRSERGLSLCVQTPVVTLARQSDGGKNVLLLFLYFYRH